MKDFFLVLAFLSRLLVFSQSFSWESGKHFLESERNKNEKLAMRVLDSKPEDKSMLSNWPDALLCSNENGTGAVLVLAGNDSINKHYYYAQIYPEKRSIDFYLDGTYKSRYGEDSITKDCEGLSIAQLYEKKKAFNFSISKAFDETGASTVLKSWPDALNCGVEESAGAIFLLQGNNTKDGHYVYVQISFNGEFRFIYFDFNGNYKSSEGDQISRQGCDNQSITDLYKAGRAFNFVSSKNKNSGTIMPQWPDALMCGMEHVAGVLILNGFSTPFSHVYYYQLVYNEYRYVAFLQNGSFFSMGGDNYTTRGCEGKTFSQLYDEGRAFNFGINHNFYAPPFLGQHNSNSSQTNTNINNSEDSSNSNVPSVGWILLGVYLGICSIVGFYCVYDKNKDNRSDFECCEPFWGGFFFTIIGTILVAVTLGIALIAIIPKLQRRSEQVHHT